MGPESTTPPPARGSATAWESIQVALDTLGANKLRTGLTMLGIIIGVFAVISLVSLGASARRYVADQFAALGSNVMMIMPGKRETIGSGMVVGVSNVHKLTMEDAEAIAGACLRSAASRRSSTGSAWSNRRGFRGTPG
ncbi:MAG: ABC transporter permease [Candidatus Aminicenantes bacterium]|nr:ABC transporter permease [Candidatus Aminicenantes bacterium]